MHLSANQGATGKFAHGLSEDAEHFYTEQLASAVDQVRLNAHLHPFCLTHPVSDFLSSAQPKQTLKFMMHVLCLLQELYQETFSSPPLECPTTVLLPHLPCSLQASWTR